MKVCVFQVQRTEPVPCANLREDLLQRDHPERPSHECVIQASEIEDGPVRPWRDSTLSSSCPADQEDAGGAGSNAILGRGPWRFGGGWRLAERERLRGC